MAWALSHSKTISSAYSRSKSLSPGNRSTPPSLTFIRAVSRMSSMAKLKGNGEIGQPCLTPLLEWNNGERWLYVFILSEVFVYRDFRMLINFSGTLFFNRQSQRTVLSNESKATLISRNVTIVGL
ncbi:unnamed protein product [Schistosoma mattheei]|uniref:Uncharacterized protein n=1 Tax=Schistosoma mattheei TaxID=31246 RepID=A0A183P3P8_9TREM|nr:unnamed protein product [Schistosoma mattheei]